MDLRYPSLILMTYKRELRVLDPINKINNITQLKKKLCLPYFNDN